MEKVTVLGAGSWGTALAILLVQKELPTWLWARNDGEARLLDLERENRRYLPGVAIPAGLQITTSLPDALEGSSAVVISVPSHAVRQLARQARSLLPAGAVVINTAKGLEQDSLQRLSQVLESELDGCGCPVAVLSGPSHAEEVSRRLPSTVVAAARSRQVAELVQDIFITPYFRVYTNPDLVGVELGGALKNCIALAAGITDGLGMGVNTRAALITRGLTEITRLGQAMGAEPMTFSGLTGIGDLVVTCTSRLSRNWQAGYRLGQGLPLDETLRQVGMVVEGVNTTRAAHILAQRHGVEMPIVEHAYQVLFAGLDPRQAVEQLMGRGRTHDVEEVASNFAPWNRD